MKFVHCGFTFELSSANDRFTSLIVETPSVQLPDGWKPKPSEPSAIPTFTAPPEPYLSSVQQEVRAIRGALTLWGVIDIDVDQAKADFLPETAAERKELDVLGFHLKKRPRTDLPMVPAAPDMLVRCILSRSEFAPYEVPFEFYRRGCDDCYYSHSVEAIFNFFFVLEYLFGAGKFKSTQLEAEFLKSSDLKSAVTEAQEQLISPALQSTRWVASAIAKYGRSLFANIVAAIIELRGFLHHQSLNRRKNWNPGTQAEFEADAHFLEFVCQAVLMKPALAILFASTAIHEFVSTPVFGPNDQQIAWKAIPPSESESRLPTN